MQRASDIDTAMLVLWDVTILHKLSLSLISPHILLHFACCAWRMCYSHVGSGCRVHGCLWPRYLGGPLFYSTELGLSHVMERLSIYVSKKQEGEEGLIHTLTLSLSVCLLVCLLSLSLSLSLSSTRHVYRLITRSYGPRRQHFVGMQKRERFQIYSRARWNSSQNCST